jgi:hypothetical protein
MALSESLREKKSDLKMYLFFDSSNAGFLDGTRMLADKMRLALEDWPLRELICVPRIVEEWARSEHGGMS